MAKALIFGSGPLGNVARIRPLLDGAEMVICADGGVAYAEQLGLRPNLVVGDFDSAAPGTRERLERQGIRLQVLPVEKDWTDLHLALEAAVTEGATDLVVMGALGGRLDHTLGAILLLPGLPPRVRCRLTDGDNVAEMIGPGAGISLDAPKGSLVSLLPLSPRVLGVNTRGLKWRLREAELIWGQSLGLSNVITSKPCNVSIGDGYLVVIQSREGQAS